MSLSLFLDLVQYYDLDLEVLLLLRVCHASLVRASCKSTEIDQTVASYNTLPFFFFVLFHELALDIQR